MIVAVHLYEAEGFQEDGYHAPTRWVDVKIQSTDREVELTVGRLFFTDFGPDSTWEKLKIDYPVITVVKNDLGVGENV